MTAQPSLFRLKARKVFHEPDEPCCLLARQYWVSFFILNRYHTMAANHDSVHWICTLPYWWWHIEDHNYWQNTLWNMWNAGWENTLWPSFLGHLYLSDIGGVSRCPNSDVYVYASRNLRGRAELFVAEAVSKKGRMLHPTALVFYD